MRKVSPVTGDIDLTMLAVLLVRVFRKLASGQSALIKNMYRIAWRGTHG